MSKTESAVKIIRRIVAIVVFIICFVSAVFLSSSAVFSYLFSTDVNMYLASGKPLTGVVTNRSRSAGCYYLIVDTEKFGVIDVECTLQEYKDIAAGTDIQLTFQYVIEQEGISNGT